MGHAEEIYQLYPRKVGRREALKAIEKALARLRNGSETIARDAAEFLKETTKQFADSPAGNRGTFTPYPSTFFNHSRYLDNQDEWWVMNKDEEKALRLRAEARVGYAGE